MSSLNVAVAQIESTLGDVEANVRKHVEMIDAARAAGVGVLLFPELSLTGHGAGADTLRLAIDRKHRIVETISRAAGSMCTIFGAIEEAAAAQFYNAAIAVRDGGVLFVHRKINLATYGKLEDGKHFAAGDRIETFDCDAAWRVSTLICADMWNPALVHLAALRGVTLLLAPISSAIEAVGDHFDNPGGWDINLRFYALTYGVPVMMANRVGREGGLTFWGGSRILDPFGCQIAAAAGNSEQLVRAKLDFDDVRRARYQLPTLRDANLPLLEREIARLPRQ
ncbi:MAG TPA: nitrilase-related carbon-nitrogen hydrolase [Casimicrobiaceae bacterium]|nr:nitrilase-related carbon-nitrogen hydrolase [Casimicrobiaceae bacterium]